MRNQGQAVIELIDTSPIPLREARFAWPEAGSRVRGLNMYVHYDPQAHMPVCFKLSSPKLSDIAQARAMSIQPGTIYVFDKGFADYSWWQEICEAKAIFITRLKSNAHRRDVAPMGGAIEAPILADNRLRIGHKKPRGGADNQLYDTPLREVLVERDGKTPLRLITNDFKRPAIEIAELYKQRWQACPRLRA